MTLAPDALLAALIPEFRTTLVSSTHTCTAIHYRMSGRGRSAMPVAETCGRDLDHVTPDGLPMCSAGHPTLTAN